MWQCYRVTTQTTAETMSHHGGVACWVIHILRIRNNIFCTWPHLNFVYSPEDFLRNFIEAMGYSCQNTHKHPPSALWTINSRVT